MKSKKGFTLIELLVVVLIIGILVAIAVPQYQIAVDKSRYSSMINMARGFADAQEFFYTANGRYADNWDELDISLPNKENLPTIQSEGNRLFIGPFGFNLSSAYMSAIYFDGENRIAAYTIYYRYSINSNAKSVRCTTYASRKKRGDAICKSVGGQLINSVNCGDTGNGICNQYKLYDW